MLSRLWLPLRCFGRSLGCRSAAVLYSIQPPTCSSEAESGETSLRKLERVAFRNNGSAASARAWKEWYPSTDMSKGTIVRAFAGAARSSIRGRNTPGVRVDGSVIRDLPTLLAKAEARAKAWHPSDLHAAFDNVVKLPGQSADDAKLLHRVLAVLSAAYLPHIPNLAQPHLCTIPLWACAKADYWDRQLVTALLGRLAWDGGRLLVQASGQEHANLWWAMSKAPKEVVAEADGLLHASAIFVQHMSAQQLSPQNCSNILLACVRLQRRHDPLLHHLAACLVQLLPNTNCQDLANSLYALAVLGCSGGAHAAAVQQLCYEVHQRLRGPSAREFVPQALSNLLWALERLRPDDTQELVQALAAECRRRSFAGFNAQDISNAAWALAKLWYSEACAPSVHQQQDWFKAAAIAASAPGAMSGASAQAWSNLWYAFALVRHRPGPGLLQAVQADVHLEALRNRANSQACANLLWSLAGLGSYDQRLVDVLVKRLGELVGRPQGPSKGGEGPTMQNLTNSLWALAVMGPDVLSRHSGLVEGLLREVVRRWEREGKTSTSMEGLVQLWQVQQELEHISSGRGSGKQLSRILAAADGERTTSLLHAMKHAVEEGRAADDNANPQLLPQAANTLVRLQGQLAGQTASKSSKASNNVTGSSCTTTGPTILAIQQKQQLDGICGCVDIVLEMEGGRRVAVEVNGPLNFLASHRRTKTGPTQLRDRQLERVFGAGNVVSVPYWEWDKLQGPEAREQYMARLLGLTLPGQQQTAGTTAEVDE
ncbi:hypothetical protein Agub_g3171 [Astrephomene gubernaculifera]|uniref:RAP domain-containing protein n=1 Tax=Astrephomene gubernaculifera TaxID=47775 RepID=A0AAD3HI81_9CHLO|nr:hypothetical protein Agub_g3171 [Astrephomene gubernaculifera]